MCLCSYDVREDIQAFGKHWYDDGNLGGRAFFGGENKTSYLSIENLKQSDQGTEIEMGFFGEEV